MIFAEDSVELSLFIGTVLHDFPLIPLYLHLYAVQIFLL